jgi:nucleoid-associated protein YgaU
MAADCCIVASSCDPPCVQTRDTCDTIALNTNIDPIRIRLMRRLTLLAVVAFLAACSSQPTTPSAESGTPPAPPAPTTPAAGSAPEAPAPAAVPEAAAPAAPAPTSGTSSTAEGVPAQTAAKKIPSGYRLEKRGGKEFYCRSVTTAGSRFAEKTCFPRAQFEEISERTESVVDDMEPGE